MNQHGVQLTASPHRECPQFAAKESSTEFREFVTQKSRVTPESAGCGARCNERLLAAKFISPVE
jgi:hypothetical protein